jgi:peptidoglycan-associated lipoprotein
MKLILTLSSILSLVFLIGCAKDVKRGPGTGADGTGSLGDGSEPIYGQTLPDRDESFNPENADYATLAAYTVLFAFDSFTIAPAERIKLERTSQYLSEYPTVRIIVAGHTDSRGTIQYNLGLGERRANAVRDYLIGLGVSANRVQTISYGEERPKDPSSNEAAWAQNRRAEIGILR